MNDNSDDLIPATPSADDYAKEAEQQEAFGAEDDQGDVFGDEEDPMALFRAWLELASEHEVNDPNAMAVSSVDAEGFPDSRMVLLKEIDDGFTFYTNLESAKGEQLRQHAACVLLFHWKSIRRQVRIRGRAELISEETADRYFAKRDRGSRIGAWASQQSREMTSEDILVKRVSDYQSIFEGKDVPRPDFWRGFRVVPREIEFWVNRPFRLHDRRRFERTQEGWAVSSLYP